MADAMVAERPATLSVHDPARGGVVAELPVDDADGVAAAVARARAAQPAWARPAGARPRPRAAHARAASWSAPGARSSTAWSARPARRASTSSAS